MKSIKAVQSFMDVDVRRGHKLVLHSLYAFIFRQELFRGIFYGFILRSQNNEEKCVATGGMI